MEKIDPLFGSMKFRRSFGFFGAGFWEGEADFSPVGKVVKVYVAAGRRGISQTQQTFYRELEERYPELVEGIQKIIVDTPLNYFGNDFFGNLMPKLDWKDFELDSIGIPKIKKSQLVEWQMSYRYMPMTETYSVYFEDWRPIYGKLDD